MAKINNTAAYQISTPVVGSDIVIGSALGNNGDTKNFQMSDISAYVVSNVPVPTLDQVCLVGSSTTTGITVAGVTTLNGSLDVNSTADVSNTLTLSKPTGTGLQVTANAIVSGTLTVSSPLDVNSTADVSDTLTLSKPTGTGLQVTSDASIGGALTTLGATITNAGLAVNGSGGIIVGSTSGITSFGPIAGTALNSTGGLLVSGTSILGVIDAGGVADIADTLTLSKVSGTGLQVDANATIDGILYLTRTGGNGLSVTDGVNIGGGIDCYGLHHQWGALTVESTATFNNKIVLNGSAPATATSTGEVGQIAVDADYVYVCTATDTWKRVGISVW